MCSVTTCASIMHTLACLSVVYIHSIMYTLSVSCQVFSRVGDTLRVELYDMSRSEEISINEQLVLEGYAAKCEEPYLSKVSK